MGKTLKSCVFSGYLRKIVKKHWVFLIFGVKLLKKHCVFFIFGVILCDPEGTATTALVPFHRAPGKSEIPTLSSSVLRAAS